MDNLSHAVSDTTGPGDGTVDAMCDLVLNIEKAGKSSNGNFCVPCLRAVGETVNDHRWR
ncbi:hypothetical protein PV646_41105 [Streptomyces sp. ID05-26A]|nr:hypothetical protein [Streptomyces sp. ID05-26A]